MSLIASRSAIFGSRVAVSGGFISVDLQLYLPIFGTDLEGLYRREGGEGLGTSGAQVEQRSVARTFNGTGGGIELAFGERAVIVRASILDREQRSPAVEDA